MKEEEIRYGGKGDKQEREGGRRKIEKQRKKRKCREERGRGIEGRGEKSRRGLRSELIYMLPRKSEMATLVLSCRVASFGK